jgi:hypothetical protein
LTWVQKTLTLILAENLSPTPTPQKKEQKKFLASFMLCGSQNIKFRVFYDVGCRGPASEEEKRRYGNAQRICEGLS